MTLKDRSDRREDKAARKRARLLRNLQQSNGQVDEDGQVLDGEMDAPAASALTLQPTPMQQVAAPSSSTELTSRRAKIISLTRSTLKLEPATMPVPADEEAQHPRLLIGPVTQAAKSHWLIWSALLAVGLPTLITALYFIVFASPQYYSEGRFAIRTGDSSAPAVDTGIAASLGIGATSSTTSDAYIVVEYLESRRLVEDLQARIDLRKLYSRPEGDFYARLDSDVSIEKLVAYWQSMTYAYFDSMTGIVQFSVRAFTPDDAQKIATAALESAEKLINDLSRRARDDSLQTAKDDLSRAELRLRFARKAIREFRDREKQIDPTAFAAQRMSVLQGLEQSLAEEEASRATVDSFLNADAPSVKMMTNKIDALKKRIDEERSKLGNADAETGKGNPEVMSTVMAEFEELDTERTFAEELYKSSLASMEAARAAAERKMRYVASFVVPNRAEDAEYPERIKDTLLVFFACGLVWIVAVLVVFGVRDQAA